MVVSRSAAAPSTNTNPLFNDPAIRYARVESPGDEPPAERGLLDVAVLDMNHGYPNLGHSSIVEVLLTIGNEERQAIGPRAPEFRVVSFDVRAGNAVPSLSRWRFPLVVGTGGPGSLDPRENDGVSELSQGIHEDGAWESPLWRLFDRILSDEATALLGICHSFGLISRWSGAAHSVFRGAERGKSAGVVRNVLTDAARTHPWFSGFYEAAGGAEIEVMDSRLFDLIPTGVGRGVALAYEADPAGTAGEALTMLELARDVDGVMPRVWAVNHHPEIGDRGRQRERLGRLEARHEVSDDWIAERRAALAAWNASAATEQRLQTTSWFTFEQPVRHFIARALLEASSQRLSVAAR